VRSITGGAKSKVKSSAQRAIRSKVLEEYPKLEPYIEDILPKKEQLDLVKLYVYTYIHATVMP
jgi:PUA domain protein